MCGGSADPFLSKFLVRLSEPRKTCLMGDSTDLRYGYGAIVHEAVPWGPLVMYIKHFVELRMECTFNSAFLNYYEDGSHSMGWHADDEEVSIFGSVGFWRLFADKCIVWLSSHWYATRVSRPYR